MAIFKQLWALLSRATRQNRPDEPIEAFEICEAMTDEELRAKLNEILCETCGNWNGCKKDKLFDDHYPECPRHPANVEYEQELVEQEIKCQQC
jgi:hypothetical protein